MIHEYSEADRQSRWFRQHKADLERERDRLRAQNDTDLDPVKTAMLRGKLQLINQLLREMGVVEMPQPKVTSTYHL